MMPCQISVRGSNSHTGLFCNVLYLSPSFIPKPSFPSHPLRCPLQADFYQDNGTYISNIVSVGPEETEDLYMTFTFSIVVPEGTDTQAEYANTVTMGLETVKHTIEVVRGLAKEGKL